MSRAALVAAMIAIGCGGTAAPAPTAPAPAPAPIAAAAPAPPTAAPDRWRDVDPARLWQRVAVVGASVSAGFAAPRVADRVRGSLAAIDDDVVLDAANLHMVRDPWGDGARQVDAAIGHHAILVLAIAFLFWYAYQPGDAAARAASLERGLAELARLDVPLAVGDVPDMRQADPRMLPAAVVPSPAELDALNSRVRAWAAARPRTAVLPLHAWSARLATDEPVELAPGDTVAARRLLFVDGLHVNPLGLGWMLVQIDVQLERELGVPIDAVTFARP